MTHKKDRTAGCTRRAFIHKVGAGALAMRAAGCLPHVDGEWEDCKKTDGGTPAPVSNRVVEVFSPGVADLDLLAIVMPERIPEMVRAGLLALTGAADLAAAWGAILPGREDGETVGLKVNALLAAKLKNAPEVVQALTSSLRADAGLARDDIVVWDRTWKELERARLTEERLDVPCQGTEAESPQTAIGYETEAMCLSDRPIRLSKLLTQRIQHLINMPVLKGHEVEAFKFTGCLKNHYGSFSNPGDFHDDHNHIARLNTLPQIASVTRLNVMEALLAVCGGNNIAFPDHAPCRLLFGFDPVAVDRRAVALRDEMLGRDGGAVPYLDVATELGVGAKDYDLVRVEV